MATWIPPSEKRDRQPREESNRTEPRAFTREGMRPLFRPTAAAKQWETPRLPLHMHMHVHMHMHMHPMSNPRQRMHRCGNESGS
mmetsp:Transcript_14541/g.30933  ORF Transcript_14541/g.30933 Transcript_14541/m.30933 type:complete len:84 (-) Transcript_14541:234-485(-)